MVVKIGQHSLSKTMRHWLAVAGFICLTLYAITGWLDNKAISFWLISKASAAENVRCAINKNQMNQLKQSATGFFKNFRFAEQPYYAGNLMFQTAEGQNMTLSTFKGKTLLVNLWAIWCGPCRTEMPQLALLQKNLSGGDFQVVAINIDNNSTEKVTAFMKSVNAENLTLYRDKAMASFNEVARQSLALGLPVTLLLDKNSCLIGSYNGSAPWGNDDSKTLMEAAIASQTH